MLDYRFSREYISFYHTDIPSSILIVNTDVCAHCSYGFGAYFNILPGSEWSAIMLTYGFPLAIIGMALKVKFTSVSTGIV